MSKVWDASEGCQESEITLSVWYCIPSARPPEQVEPIVALWHERGYKVALWRDEGPLSCADMNTVGPYQGYGASVNALARGVLAGDPSCDWIVTGGDDTLPDPNHTAEEIAEQCSEYSRGLLYNGFNHCIPSSTFLVMQPTGDRFAGGSIDRIAGSPWMGREWCLRINQGKGPLWPEYKHMFDDEELQCVATKLGVFWQRPDLVHLHRHFQRESDALDAKAVARPIPPHLVKANSKEHWDRVKALFEWRKANNFPGHEPL